MRDFLKALSAEVLKLKRTLALWLGVIAPLVVITLQVLYVLRAPSRHLKNGLWPLLQQSLMPWSILLLPLTAALLTALLNGIEHRDGNWKQLYALPVSRWSVYAAKVAAAHGVLALATVTLWIGLIAAGVILHALLPSIPYGPPPVLPLLRRLSLIFCASSALIAIHVWVSARSKSFTVPIGLGIVGVIVSALAARDNLMIYSPWLFPGNAMVDERWVAAVVLGVCGGVVIAVVGAWDACRRDVL